MFNKSLFNKTLFNKRVDKEEAPTLTLALSGRGKSSFDLQYLIQTGSIIRGRSQVIPGVIIAKDVDLITLSGSSKLLTDSSMAFPIPIKSVILSGTGSVKTNIIYEKPITFNVLSGASVFSSQSFILGQETHVKMSSNSKWSSLIVFQLPFEVDPMKSGGSTLRLSRVLLKDLVSPFTLSGSGHLDEARVGARHQHVLQLNNVKLRPGEEIIIDTNTLEVWVRGVLDVDFVSPNSEFFDLYPGLNQIAVNTPGQTSPIKANIDVIWNNRWL